MGIASAGRNVDGLMNEYHLGQLTPTYYNIARLRFGQVYTCTFNVAIDPNNLYSSYIQSYGTKPPATLVIPFNVIYNKYNRTGDTTNDVFYSSYQAISYTPATVSLTYSFGNMSSLFTLNTCRVKSSVNDPQSIPANAFTLTTVWQFDSSQQGYIVTIASSRIVYAVFLFQALVQLGRYCLRLFARGKIVK
ncbi:unnamed protein product [Sphagnum balticum]